MRYSNSIKGFSVLMIGALAFSSAGIAKGFIDHKGTTVFALPPSALCGPRFSEGLVRVELPSTGWAFFDREGKQALTCPEHLEFAREFYDGLCAVAVRRKDGLKWGFIDHSGKFVVAPTLSDVYSFSEGLAPVRVGGDWVRREGELVPRLIGGKWGYIAKDGRFVIEPQFDMALQFSEGRAAVLKDEKAGFIDPEGKLVIPLQYNVANSFSEGLAFVTVWETPTGPDHSWFIDKEGNKVLDIDQLRLQFKQYDPSAPNPKRHYGCSPDYNGRMLYTGGPRYSLYQPSSSSRSDTYFQEGLLPWGINGRLGYVDKKGTIVVPPRFRYAGHFSEGLAVAQTKEGGDKQGFIDKSGQLVIAPRYSWADDFHEGVAVVSGRLGNEEFIDQTGKTIYRARGGASAFHEGLARVGWPFDNDFTDAGY